MSFAELRKQIRMNNAAELLSADDYISIDEVAAQLGYSDRFLSSLFSSLLLQHLEKILSGDDASCAEDASSFAAFLEKISSH